MNYDKIASCVQPLLRAAAPQEERWLRRLFESPASFDVYSALDNELFVRDGYSTGPLLVTSAVRSEGRTTVALLLAVLTSAFDRSRKVLLVDADTDNGHLAAIFGLREIKCGLRELFDGEASAAECIYQTAVPNLWLTPQAKIAGGASRSSPKSFQAFIEEVRNRFDLVVVDSPAGGRNKDVFSMARIVKNTLVVVKYGGPTREQIASLLGELDRAGAQVLGCVLNQREYAVPNFLYGSR